jgi:hypothetical protein
MLNFIIYLPWLHEAKPMEIVDGYDKWNILYVVICDIGQPSHHGGDRKTFEVITSI